MPQVWDEIEKIKIRVAKLEANKQKEKQPSKSKR